MSNLQDDALERLLKDLRAQEVRSQLKTSDQLLLDQAWETVLASFPLSRLRDSADTFAVDDLIQMVIEEYKRLKAQD
jgi:hypothetical protein